MQTRNVLDCLQLDNELALDDDIQPIVPNVDVFVRDRNAELALELDSSESQLHRECLFIDRFRKARAEKSVHFDRSTNGSVREIIELRGTLPAKQANDL